MSLITLYCTIDKTLIYISVNQVNSSHQVKFHHVPSIDNTKSIKFVATQRLPAV